MPMSTMVKEMTECGRVSLCMLPPMGVMGVLLSFGRMVAVRPLWEDGDV